MPLIYQGQINTKTIRSLNRALKIGKSTLDSICNVGRLDLRYAWQTTDNWEPCDELLPPDFDGYWMDVAAHADPELVLQCSKWISEMKGGSISLLSLKNDAEAEIAISLKGVGPERYDDQRFEARFSHQTKRRRVRTQALNHPGVMSKGRKASCAARALSAYESLDPMIDGIQPGLVPWLETSGHDIDPKWLQATPQTGKTWFPEIHSVPHARPISDLELKALVMEQCLTGLSLDTEAGADDLAEHVWRTWTSGLDKLDVVIIRCMGKRSELLNLLDQLDLYHFHPHQNEHMYGVSTLHYETPLSESLIDQLTENPRVNDAVVDWDVRWSGLEFNLDDQPANRIGRSDSSYLIRTASAKTVDRLVVSVELDDPRDAAFRSLRRQLASGLGDALSQEAAWEFDGPSIDSPVGRHYATLTDRLKTSLQDTLETMVEVPPRPGNPLVNLLGMLSRSKSDVSFLESITDVIEHALPGFRYDRKAHVTDRYFVEFTRRSPGGVHLIQIQRGHQPPGFSIRLAVSLLHIPFDDLTPGSGRATPGIIVPLEDLVPERNPYWDLSNNAVAKRTLEDLQTVLALRARPFLDGAERALVDFRTLQEERTR